MKRLDYYVEEFEEMKVTKEIVRTKNIKKSTFNPAPLRNIKPTDLSIPPVPVFPIPQKQKQAKQMR